MIGSVFGVPALLDMAGEAATREMLSTFSCVSDGVQLNEEVEDFVKNNAIEFYKRKMSVTYLVNNEDDRLAGIFTLTHKAIDIPATDMSNAQKKKIQRFAQLDQDMYVFRASAYLIAQFGKNYAVDNGMSIRGTELMECAMSVLHDVQEMVGGGLVYLECEEDNNKAYDFYIKCGFKVFDRRFSLIDQQNYILMMKTFSRLF